MPKPVRKVSPGPPKPSMPKGADVHPPAHPAGGPASEGSQVARRIVPAGRVQAPRRDSPKGS
jgi:hypothetical protein